jgi:glc operon protein GlcG
MTQRFRPRFREVIFLFVAVSSMLSAGRVAAQGVDKFVITGDDAKRALSKVEISGETAEKLAKVCEAYATEHKISVTIFIISPSGSIVHAHRMDGQGPINIETALYKAQTALYTRRPTSFYEKEYATDVPAEVARVKLNQYYVSGGLPIIVDDQLIGAIGVGGSRDGDEQCAYAALTKVLGPQPPLTSSPAPTPKAPASK